MNWRIKTHLKRIGIQEKQTTRIIREEGNLIEK